MAIGTTDSFDTYNGGGALTGLQAKWVVTSAPTLVAGRFGGQAMRLSSGGAVSAERAFGLGATANMCLHIASRVTTLPTSNGILGHYVVKTGATWQCGIRFNTSGGIDAYRLSGDQAGTLLGSSANGLITSASWNTLEVEIVISTTVGRITVYLNGDVTPIINLTGQNTANAGVGTTADTFRVNIINGSTGIGSIDTDDYYQTTTAAKLGEAKFEPLVPTSDVAQGFARSAGAVNFSLVDEIPNNGDTDYVQASALNTIDTYGFADLATSPATILAVVATAFAEKTDVASRSIGLQVISGATTSVGPNFALASTYGKFDRIMETDPNTAAAWTAANVNALTGGPKVTV